MSQRPLCFVLMPFGRKADPAGGRTIDFDRIHESAIAPGIEDAGLEPIRADEERTGGVIHAAMFERLLLCDFAVADLTTANPNVFYELGVRHAVRPHTTLSIFARGQPPPFDVHHVRALPYDAGGRAGFGEDEAAALRAALAARLGQLRQLAREDAVPDSPVFQLIADLEPPDVAHLKTDTFRDRARYSARVKRALAAARSAGDLDAVRRVESEVGPLDAVEAGVAVDLLLSHRALEDWPGMIALAERLPVALQRVVLVREQLAFALNRSGQRDRAAEVLEEVVAEHGPSPETLGLLGRVHKDRWQEALAAGRKAEAAGHLRQAIETYARGFEADWRDAYPGVNAVTLLDVEGSDASLRRRDELLPVVHFAVLQKMKAGTPDYWDHATLLELAVLGDDEDAARRHLADALAAVPEPWEPETTAGNLELIRTARLGRGEETDWLGDALRELLSGAD